ncbi:MAG: ATP-binding protein [Lachnospiraceae bacterium]|nr:ATP-binding protein [Lachnospiraceae bacterium]
MKAITIEELEKLNTDEVTIIDVRQEKDFKMGTFRNSINMPIANFENCIATIPKEKPVFILCYTGDKSVDVVERLEELGFDTANIIGGYRSLLRLQLSRILQEEEAIALRTFEIERSIIKKFRKTIWRKFTKAINDYEFVQEGDKIAVCISGGKDSMLLAKLMQELHKHGKVQFELKFLVMNPGYNEENWKIIQDNAKILGIPLTTFESDIFNIVADIDKNPCYLCARMRRGYLYSQAKELGCNKIALGHHFDDVIETVLMGMLYGGKIETMMPKLHSKNFEGMELIRPLYMVKEGDIKGWRDYNQLHFIQCACRFTENCVSCGGGRGSKRDEMKELIKQFRASSDVIEKNIFKSIHNINLRTVIGYHKDDEVYNFLDDYNKE